MKTQTVSIIPMAIALAALNSWGILQTAAAGFVEVSPMNRGRAYHTATLLPNGKVLLVGTRVAGPDTATSAELYDPETGEWTLTGSMRSFCGYAYHTATLLPNGKVLIAGGCQLVVPAELYNPATGMWTLTGPMTAPRLHHAATLLPNGKVLVTGGGPDHGDWTATAELYDPATGTWTATGPMTQARGFHTATLLLNGKVLVAGGSSSTRAELYDPATGTWTVTGAPSGGQFSGTLLLNGKVLATGFVTVGGQVPTAELYDPDSGTWSATDSPRWGHGGGTATLLRNGKVLVAGGAQATDPAIPSAELYDPAAGTWTETPMSGYRYTHTATLLPNGKVLVAGGVDSRNINLSTAELYEPDSDGAAPSITLLHHSDRIMSFSWTGAGTLEQSDNLTDWLPAVVQDNPHIVSTASGPGKFFRVSPSP